MTSPPYVAIALVSGAALGYEVLLMRLFAIIQWHHFAHMVISLALLGYGASGAFLAFTAQRLQGRFSVAFAGNAFLFGVTAVGAFLLAQALPFNALELLWDPVQPAWLAAAYLILSVPFFFAANCIGLSLYGFPRAIPRTYAYDLVGAGLGALGIVLFLYLLPAQALLLVVGALGMAAAALVPGLGSAWGRGAAVLLAVVGLGLAIGLPDQTVRLALSPYKGLSQSLNVFGAELMTQRSSPLGLLSVVGSPRVPFRHAPGLSLNNAIEPPEQLAVFTDGEGMSVITRFDKDMERLGYLGFLTSAAPYSLLESPRVLILGAGGGADVLQAVFHGAAQVDAVELNAQMVALVSEDYADFAGRLYEHEGVTIYEAEARGYVAGSVQRYDLIQVALLDSFSASSAGLHALSESYLYTVEALEEYLSHLAPGGVLAITRWVKLPPRGGLKLFATAVAALERSGAGAPAERLAWLRSWNTSTLLVKNDPFTAAEVEALRRFAQRGSFDIVYVPGMGAGEANRYNVLDRPLFHDGALSILGPERDGFYERYKFDIRPTTDDRPYFFNFFKWRAVPEILALRQQGGMALLDSGYLILVVTLAQALVASLLLVGLPAWLQARRGLVGASRSLRWAVLGYFLAIGFSFLFIEIAFIQRFILFLAHPVYAAAVVLAGFLLFAGLGSRYAQGLWEGRRNRRGSPLTGVVAGVALIAVVYLFVLPPLFDALMAWPDVFKIGIALMLIAPLAFLMGFPFPLALAGLGEVAGELIPWAWAINGCASVLSAVIATMLAIHYGFTVVVLVALLLYALAGWIGGRYLVGAPAALGSSTGVAT